MKCATTVEVAVKLQEEQRWSVFISSTTTQIVLTWSTMEPEGTLRDIKGHGGHEGTWGDIKEPGGTWEDIKGHRGTWRDIKEHGEWRDMEGHRGT